MATAIRPIPPPARAAASFDPKDLLDSLPVAVVVHTGERIVWANPAAALLIGAASPGEILGRSPIEFVHPDCRAAAAERMRGILAGGGPAEALEERFVRLDGQEIDVEVLAHPVRTEGRPAVQVTIRDVTERRQAEAVLRASREQLAEAQSLARLGSWELEIGPDGDLSRGRMRWSDEVFRMFGHAPGSFDPTSESFIAAVHPDERAGVRAAAERAIAGGEPFDVRHRIVLADRRERVVHGRFRVFRDAGGGPTRLIGTVQDVTEWKRAEDVNRRLREREQRHAARFRLLLDTTGEAIFGVDVDGRCTFANRASAAIFGYAENEVLGRSLHETVHHTRADGTPYPADECPMLEAMRDGRPIRLDGEVLWRKDGSSLVAEYRSLPLLEDGRCRGAVVSVVDVTERERTKRAVQSSERKFRTVFDSSLDALSLHSVPDGRYLDVNRSFEALTGFSKREALGRTAVEMGLWTSADDLDAAMRAVAEEGVLRDREMSLRAKDGREIRALLSLTRLEVDGRSLVLASTRDVTESRRAERELVETRDRLNEILESLDRVFWSTDARTGEVLHVSHACASIYGHPAKTFLESPRLWREATVAEDRPIVAAAYERVAAGEAATVQYRIRRADGDMRWVETHMKPALDPDGRVAHVNGVTADVTDRRLAEDELSRAKDAALEASRLKSAFLANMSHEVRTPLNVILGMNDFVAQHLEEIGDRSQNDHLARVRRASDRLLKTIHGILDLSKLETGSFEIRPERVDVAAVIGRLVRSHRAAAQARGVTIRVAMEVPRAELEFDEYCLTQVLGNLIDNAVKFTVRGSVGVRVGRDGGALVVEVSDTGVGIDEAFLPRLFEPFCQEDAGYTRHFEGSGLGLALVKRYLQMNDANIEVESRKGTGSVFRIRFAPQGEMRAAAAEGSSDRSPVVQQAKPLVLVVEDDADTQGYMAALLGRAYTVRLAANGDELRREVALAGEKLRLVLMDLSLSGPEDGLGLTRHLRSQEATRELPIIAVTAHAMPKDRENALRAGCDEYVSKPIDRAELFAKIDRLLAGERD